MNAPAEGLTERLVRLAEWYESGPSYPVEFEAGRQCIAADIRAVLAENERLSRAVIGGILGDLLKDDEQAALVDFIRSLRADK